MRHMLQQCADILVRHLDGAFARIWTLNDAEQVLSSRPALACIRTSTGRTAGCQSAHSRSASLPRSASPT